MVAAIHLLRRYSLIESSVHTDGYSMHTAIITTKQAEITVDQLALYFLGSQHMTPEGRYGGMRSIRDVKKFIKEGKTRGLQQKRIEGYFKPLSS